MASRVLGAFAVTATAALATLAMATPASAHTNVLKADCDEKTQKTTLSVDLTRYGSEQRNTLEVSIDGVAQKHKVTFGSSHKETGWDADGTDKRTYKVKITAYDDRDGFGPNPSWSKEIELPPTKVCKTPDKPKPEQPKPPVPEQPKPEVPNPPVETTTEAPSSSVAPPQAPGGSTPEPPLAATGASPLWMLLSGLGLVGAGAGTLLFLRRRRSA